MIALSIALVIIAAIAGWLVNKYLDQKMVLNTTSVNAELSAATAEMHKQFDARINKAFENHQIIKTEMDSLRLQMGLKGINK